jgi:hypothetical protein
MLDLVLWLFTSSAACCDAWMLCVVVILVVGSPPFGFAAKLDGRWDICSCLLGTRFGFDSCCVEGQALDLLSYMYVDNGVVSAECASLWCKDNSFMTCLLLVSLLC